MSKALLCARCGEELATTARYCRSCGAAAEPSDQLAHGTRHSTRVVIAVVAVSILVVGGIVLVVRLATAGGSGSAETEASSDPSRPSGEPLPSGDLGASTGDAVAILRPASATASSVLAPQVLSCTGETVTYGPENAIDGSDQTAWAPARSDGVGESITLTFRERVRLVEIGLTPGYTKVAPTTASGCQPRSRFFENRIITSARYVFDDGSSVDQSFRAEPSLQTIPVDAETTSVVIEITGTTLPDGARVEDDTLISEIGFRGRTAGS